MCIVCQARAQKPEFCYRNSDYTDAIDFCGKNTQPRRLFVAVTVVIAASTLLRPHCVMSAWAKHVWMVCLCACLELSRRQHATATRWPRGQHVSARSTENFNTSSLITLSHPSSSSYHLTIITRHLHLTSSPPYHPHNPFNQVFILLLMLCFHYLFSISL